MKSLDPQWWVLLSLLFATGCTSVRVRLTGDEGVRFQAAWSTAQAGTQTRSGAVPTTLKFDGDFTGWFQNPTGAGELRVRVYEGMSVLVDERTGRSVRRVVVERRGRGVSYRTE